MTSASTMLERALRLMPVDLAAAEACAWEAAETASRERDPATQAQALRLVGIAAGQRGSGNALVHLRAARAAAVRSRRPDVEGEVRLTLAGTLAILGRSRAALRELEKAAAVADDRPRALAQRGLVLVSLGRLDDAVRVLDEALPALEAVADHDGVLAVLINRSAGHLRRGSGAQAEADLLRAVDVAQAHDRTVDAAFAEANLASALALQGRVVEALRRFSSAEARLRATGTSVSFLLSMKAELLLSVRLLAEARETATAAQHEFAREGNAIGAADLTFLLAQVALREGDLEAARSHASSAARSYRRLARSDLATLARLSHAHASPSVPAASVARLVGAVDRTGWPGPALDVRIVAVQRALTPSQRARAADRLPEVVRFRSPRYPADVRARAWFAQALHRHVAGDPGGSLRACRRGLDILDDHAVSLPATDLRAHSAAHRVELVQHGLGLALARRSARLVAAWAERGRATHLLRRSVIPPQDERVAARLGELRAVVRDVYEARAEGAGTDVQVRLRTRQAQLERDIRDLVRQAAARDREATAGPPSSPDLARRLGARALVEYVTHDGALHAVSLVDGRARLHHLGDLATVAGLVERIPFAVQRMTRAARSPGGAAAAQTLLADAARRLDAILLGPLRETAGRDLVVVPTGVLQATPWSVLPSCQGRPVTVAPSATVWLAATRRPAPAGPVLVAAGPRLRSAPGEARAVAALHGTSALLDPGATVDAVSAALPGASLAHLATHGRLSAENPLFSHLLLSDGPLVVYDLERLDSLPHTVVLAACESGRHVVPAGDELLGLGAAFLAGGTAQLVASVVPVPDAETSDLMTALHARLVAGEPPAAALAAAQGQLAQAGPVAAATAAGFVCIGAGFVPVTRPQA